MTEMEDLNKKFLRAVKYEGVEEIQNILDLGADVNCTEAKEGDTALHIACRSNLDIVHPLLGRGCNPNIQNKKGKTALHNAAAFNNIDTIKLLLQYGCLPNQQDNMGNTALHIAADYGHPDVLKELISYDCRPDTKDNMGRTPLHVAASQVEVKPSIIRILLDGYCNPNEKDKEGKTPLHVLEEDRFCGNIDDKKKAKIMIQDYEAYLQLGLPIEVKELNKQSAKVFASLMEEEVYVHYEARVMLAGEPGTGKTTIARYLVGQAPNKIRMSTDGIDLYHGYSFINRVTEEWIQGKFGLKLSELTISRLLRQSEEKALRKNDKAKLIDRERSMPVNPKLKSIQTSTVTAEVSAQCYSSTSELTSTVREQAYDERDHACSISTGSKPSLSQIQSLQSKLIRDEDNIKKPIVKKEIEDDNKITAKAKTRNLVSDVLKFRSEIFGEDKTGVTLLYVRSLLPESSDKMISTNTIKQNDSSQSEECHSQSNIKSNEISTTIEVVKKRRFIHKLKKLFGVKKDVKEIKVYMTKDRFMKDSIKAGRKKLHQKKIAPVIIWDFGGQDVFYSTHQTLLTYRAIYLIVLDGSRTLDDPCPFEQYLPGKSGYKTARDYLKFWINTIVTYCKGSGPGFPKIMIVLTHKDKLRTVEVESKRQQMFTDIQKMYSGSPLLAHLVIEEQLFVNAKNENDPEMAKIKKIIIEQAMKQPTWGQKLPKCFIPLELEFDSLLSRNIPLITMNHLKKINSVQPVRPLTEQELKVFLKFQHCVGRILYFDEDNLDEHIILSPTHLIDAFKSIVTHRSFCEGDRMRQESWDLMSKTGIIEKKSIQDIWKKKMYKKFEDHTKYLLGVMTHLDILVEPKRYNELQNRIPADFYYVASMVRTNDTTGYLKSPKFAKRNTAIAFSHSSSMIPPALSFRFISYCLSIFAVKKYGQNDDEMLFHRSAIFNIDQSLDMCVNCDDEVIVVRLVHHRNQTLIMRDLASSIRECLAVALEKISQLYVKTSSTDNVTSKSSFDISLCCSSPDEPCILPMSILQEIDGSWICPKHGIEHTKDMMSSWAIQQDEIQCGKGCPVTNSEFLDQIPSDIHLRRLSMQYSINETKELAMHLGMTYQKWDDMYTTFVEEPDRLKFEALQISVMGSNSKFHDIRKAAEVGKIQTIHSLCQVVRGIQVDFDQEPEKWDLVPTDEHLDRLAPLVGNNSLAFLVELGMEFQTWVQIKYRKTERDLVKLNRHILQEWRSNFCSLHNIRPSLRDIGKAFNNIGKSIRIIENVLDDLL